MEISSDGTDFKNPLKDLGIPNLLEMRVDYYDSNHKKKFEEYPNHSKIDSLTKGNITISRDEFLTYLLFTEQKNAEGFRTFADFKGQILKSHFLIRGYLEFKGKTIRTIFVKKDMDTNLIERIGVSLSLCVANKIHEFTEADWSVIPITSAKKTFDFNYASDGDFLIEVESKGSTADDNRIKADNISKQKKSIEDKKESIKSERLESKRVGKVLSYGVISVLDDREDTVPQIWLLDPPPSWGVMHPKKLKLLSRLYFYWRYLKCIAPNSTFLQVLVNRIKAIVQLENYSDMDGLSLLNRNGNPLEFYESSFARKSVIGNNDIIGAVFPLDKRGLFFMGFPKNVFNLLKRQKFEEILKYKYTGSLPTSIVKCRIRANQRDDFHLPGSLQVRYSGRITKYMEFELTGNLIVPDSGRVFGILNFDTGKHDSLEE